MFASEIAKKLNRSVDSIREKITDLKINGCHKFHISSPTIKEIRDSKIKKNNE